MSCNVLTAKVQPLSPSFRLKVEPLLRSFATLGGLGALGGVYLKNEKLQQL